MKILPLLFTLSIGYLPVSNENLEINPIQPTPFNENVEITIENRAALKFGEAIFIKARSHPIGSNTYSESFEGMRTNPAGVTVLLIINGEYRLSIANINCNPMEEQLAWFHRECQIQVPSDILQTVQDKEFVINAIALNSYNESIKGRGGMAVKILGYEGCSPRDATLDKALRGPYLLYNQPDGTFDRGESVLLDFYLSEGTLSKDGNKVELYIDGEKTATLTHWVPYELVNLSPGQHTIKLVLVNIHGVPYPSPFPPQENTIYVK